MFKAAGISEFVFVLLMLSTLFLPALAGLLCRQLLCIEVEAWLLRSITNAAGVGVA